MIVFIIGIFIGLAFINIVAIAIMGNCKFVTKNTAPLIEAILINKYLHTNGNFISGWVLDLDEDRKLGTIAEIGLPKFISPFQYYYFNLETKQNFIITPSYNKEIEFFFKNARPFPESLKIYLNDFEEALNKRLYNE